MCEGRESERARDGNKNREIILRMARGEKKAIRLTGYDARLQNFYSV